VRHISQEERTFSSRYVRADRSTSEESDEIAREWRGDIVFSFVLRSLSSSTHTTGDYRFSRAVETIRPFFYSQMHSPTGGNDDCDVDLTTLDSTTPTKSLGRHRDYIWLHFVDLGEAKTGGHRKACCRYCQTVFNYAKINMMYAHIAHQCTQIVVENPQGRIETILRLEGNSQSSSSKSQKRAIEVNHFIRSFHSLNNRLHYLVSRRIHVSEAVENGSIWLTDSFNQ
jgi:hypothetical protein